MLMGYTAPNVMESINSGILPDGTVNIVNGTLTQVDPEEPGRFENSFAGKETKEFFMEIMVSFSVKNITLHYHFSPGPDGGYNVIDTDYRTYTSVYNCNSIGNLTVRNTYRYLTEVFHCTIISSYF